ETGIHIGGSSTSAGPLNQALATALGQAGITIKVLSTDSSTTSSSGTSGNTLPGKTVTSQVQGVLFHVEQFLPIPNATDTYFATMTLGSASTVAGASIERGTAPPIEAGGIGGLGTPAVPAIPGTPASVDTGTPASSSPAVANNTATRRPRTTAPRHRPGLLRQLEADLVGSLISHRFDILYLSFTLAFIGVCLSSR